jgi:hypothetical protein
MKVGLVMPSQCRRAEHSRASKRAGSERGLVEGSSGDGEVLSLTCSVYNLPPRNGHDDVVVVFYFYFQY